MSYLTKTTGLEFGRHGVLANALAPCAILSPLVDKSLKQMSPDDLKAAEKYRSKRNPLQKFGKPEEVAHLEVFLLSCEYR